MNNVCKVIIVLFVVVFSACSERKTKHIPDVSSVMVDTKVLRFEKELFNLDTTNFNTQLAALEQKDTAFSNVYFNYVLGAGNPRINKGPKTDFIKGFTQFPAVKKLYDTTQIVFSNFEPIRQDFEKSLQYFKYHFPQQPVPTLTTYVSEYSYAAFVYGDNQLAVGLDFFLGADYPYAKFNPGNSNFSDYLLRTFNKDHLLLKAWQPLIEDMVGAPSGQKLLDYMIQKGKQIYLAEQLLPFESDTVIMEYAPQQLDWVQNNEADIWAHFISEDLLYDTNFMDFRRLIEYSPNSPGMPQEAPGRTAAWTGYKIIEAYMNRNSDTTIPELLAIKDAQKILDASKYRPRRN